MEVLGKKGNPVTCYNMMTLKEIMLSKISQSQKDKQCYDSANMKHLKQLKSQKQEVQTWLSMWGRATSIEWVWSFDAATKMYTKI